MSKRKCRTRLTSEQRKNRAVELRTLLSDPDLARLNDNAAAAELNRRGVPALSGGEWQGVQITRLRARPGVQSGDRLEKQHDALERSFRANLKNLTIHFGTATSLDTDLIKYVAWIATTVQHLTYAWRAGASSITALDVRTFKRHRAMLAGLIDVVRIASDSFGHGAPASLPRASTPGVVLILERADQILAEIEAAAAPRLADPGVAGAKAAP